MCCELFLSFPEPSTPRQPSILRWPATNQGLQCGSRGADGIGLVPPMGARVDAQRPAPQTGSSHASARYPAAGPGSEAGPPSIDMAMPVVEHLGRDGTDRIEITSSSPSA